MAGLAVVIGITRWQVRTIAASRYPALKAARVPGVVLSLYLCLT